MRRFGRVGALWVPRVFCSVEPGPHRRLVGREALRSPHEDPSDDETPENARTDPEGDALGTYWRTHRQRRRSAAPYICGLAGGSVTFAVALFSDGGPLSDHLWRIALVLIPLGVACGLLFDLLAPVARRVRVDVHEHGVRIRPGEGRPVVSVPAQLGVVEDRSVPADRRPLALMWRTFTGGTAWARLDSFGSARSLRRALLDREFSRAPVRSRAAVSVVAVLVLGAFYTWLLVPRPPAVPEEREHLEAFCADPETVFPGLPAYEGEGPHPVTVVDGRLPPGLDTGRGSLDLREEMTGRGWSVDMGGAVLIACGRITLGEQLDTCAYTDSITGFSTGDDKIVPIHLARFEYDLYEAATHRPVATVEVAGTPVQGWECPFSLAESREATLAEHDLGPVVDALAPYVEGVPAD